MIDPIELEEFKMESATWLIKSDIIARECILYKYRIVQIVKKTIDRDKLKNIETYLDHFMEIDKELSLLLCSIKDHDKTLSGFKSAFQSFFSISIRKDHLRISHLLHQKENEFSIIKNKFNTSFNQIAKSSI